MSQTTSHRRASRATAVVRRLLRAQLRLKVMAGVLAVTLVALVAFDVAAVTTVRRYLLNQTDNNLQGALTLTLPRLAAVVAAGEAVNRAAGPRRPNAVPAQSRVPNGTVPALPGAFDMAFLPLRGAQVILQVAANGETKNASWTLSPVAAKVAAKPGPHTLIGPNGTTHLRVVSLRVPGGSLVAGTSLNQVYETIVQVELIVLLGSIAVVLLIGFGVFVVLRRGLRPIETMAEQADRITAGDLTDRVTPHHPGSEVGRLGTALNDMLARIEAGVQEREASQQQMRRFFTDASHELRTPLASLRANAELYQQGALRGPDEVDEVMDRIVLETRRMGRLVDDMLRLARLGQHPGQSAEPVDMTAVVAGCAERARIADPARSWRVRIADRLAMVGDEELLRRAVDNLLMNVLVHTPADAAGAISAYETGGQVVVDVSDDGPGVPPDQLPHVFERFYRGGARSRRPGSGLGLAIAAEIASAHGGLAHAAPGGSQVPRGLRITLSLPVDGRPADHPGARELMAPGFTPRARPPHDRVSLPLREAMPGT
jgi:two-component system, OmpR family, sensor kinase